MAYKLVGQEPYQLPSNADLGTLAYQNADALNVGLVNISNTASISGLVAPLTVGYAQNSAGTYVLLNQVPSNLAVGQSVSGTGIPAGTTVTSFLAGFSTAQPTYTSTTATTVIAMTSTYGMSTNMGVGGTGITYGTSLSSFSNTGLPQTYAATSATTAGTTIWVGTTTNVAVGQMVFGTGVTTSTIISSIVANTYIVVNNPVTVTSGQAVTFVPTITLSQAITANTVTQNLLFFPVVSLSQSTSAALIPGSVVNSFYASTNPTNAALVVQAGGLGVTGNAYFGNQIINTLGQNATSTATGSIVVQGGVGIWQNLYIGGNINVGGTITGAFAGSINTSSNLAGGALGSIPYQTGAGATAFIGIGATGTVLVSNGSTATWTSSIAVLSITSSTASTSTTAGALTVAGGVGIQGGMYVGGIITATNLKITGSTIVLGSSAAANGPGTNAIAIGQSAGAVGSGNYSVVIGSGAASNGAGANSVVIGVSAASGGAQGANAVAIGNYTANQNQGTGAVAIGQFAGGNQQGNYSIAIGYNGSVTGNTNDGYININSIVLNASGAIFTGSNASSFYVLPIRGDASTSATTFSLYYNPTTKEITTASGGIGFTGTSTNIAGGTTGSILYQLATSSTGFIAIGSTGSILVSNGTTSSFSNTVTTLTVSNTTVSTGTTTGALQVSGGVAILGNTNLNGNLTLGSSTPTLALGSAYLGSSPSTQLIFAQNLTGVFAYAAYNSNSLQFITNNGISIDLQTYDLPTTTFASRLKVNSTGTILISSTASAISTTTGALQVRGGLGVGGAVYAGGGVTSVSTTSFVSPNSSATITARMLNTDILTFSGARGQLFSISDSFTGTIFGVYDISGVPAIEAYDTGNVILAETFGNVGVGTTATTAKLTVAGGVSVSGIITATNLRLTGTQIALGNLAGGLPLGYTPGLESVAIGDGAGATGGGLASVYIGWAAGNSTPGNYGVGIGAYAGAFTQGSNAIGIGQFAGAYYSGANSIAIGNGAGKGQNSAGQGIGSSTIVINATGADITGTQSSSLFIAPIRADSSTSSTSYLLFYNITSKEITTSSSFGGTLTIFNTTTSLSTFTGALTVAGGVGIGGSLNVAGNSTFGNTGNYTPVSKLVVGNSPGTSSKLLTVSDMASPLNTAGAGGILVSMESGGGIYMSAGATGGSVTGKYEAYASSLGIGTMSAHPVYITAGDVTRMGISSAGIISITTTSNATSSGTGALRVAGGVGIALDLYVGGNIYSANTLSVAVSTASNIVVTDDLATATPAYITFVNATNRSTDLRTSSTRFTYVPTSGIMTVPNVFISGTAASTSTTSSNALYVGGGAYVNSLFVQNATTFGGTVTFNGTATYVYSTNTVYTDNILEMHTPPGGVASNWNFDDGKDVGLRFHYYTASTDTNAALVLANDTKYLEWYSKGYETTTGTIVTATYGTFKTGAIQLVGGTSATSVTTGDLTVTGGVGIGKNLYVNGNLIVNGAPITQQQAFTVYEFSATASQTTFTISGGYTVGQIEVFSNGVLMNSGDYTASNGSTVIFATGRYLNDLISVRTFSTFSVASSTMASRAYATAISVAMGM